MNSIRNDSKKKKDSQLFFTVETFGVVLMLFSALCIVCIITREKVFSLLGQYVCDFFVGLFGYLSIAVCFSLFVLGILLLLGKKINISVKNKALFTIVAFFVSMLLHVVSMKDYSTLSYSDFLKKTYDLGVGGIKGASAGGVVMSLVAYFVANLLTNIGAYVVVSIVSLIFVYLLISNNYKETKQNEGKSKLRSSFVKHDEEDVQNINPIDDRDYPVVGVDFSENANTSNQRLFISNPEDFELKSKREIKKNLGSRVKIDYGMEGLGIGKTEDNSYQKSYTKDMEQKINYIKKPATIDISKSLPKDEDNNDDIRISKPIKDFYSNYGKNNDDHVVVNFEKEDEHKVNDVENENQTIEDDIPLTIHEDNSNNATASDHAREFSDKYIDIPEEEITQNVVKPENNFSFTSDRQAESSFVSERQADFSFNTDRREDFSVQEETIDSESDDSFDSSFVEKEEKVEKPFESEPRISRIRETSESLFGENAQQSREAVSFRGSEERSERFDFSAENSKREESLFSPSKPAVEPPKKPKEQPPINRRYNRPPLDLLDKHEVVVDENAENHQVKMELITKMLEDFHINAVAESYIQGPSVTRYEVRMPAGVSVRRVTGLDDDLRSVLKSKSGVRIEAPIPGKDLVGIEVENAIKAPVGLREILEQSAKKPSKPGSLMFAIGKDLIGNAIVDNLADGPHYLVAGSTGSGKSVCLNVMIVSMIMRYSPEELRLILVDPKGVEFGIYEHLPHLMIDEIINDAQKTVAVLQWAYQEMQKRLEIFRNCDQRIVDISGYNEKIASDTVAKMPRIVIVIDELADLMMNCKKEMDAKIQALAQKSRAVGIHLVLATQRPSVDVITGTIKTNLPSRIALKVMNAVDSGTILGEGGAEKLLGHGDMLYKNSSMGEYERYQGAFLTDNEIMSIVEFIKENNKSYYDDDLTEYLENSIHPKQADIDSGEEPTQEGGLETTDIFKKSLAFAITLGSISISLLQRHFQIGYAKAGGIIDKMERKKYIAPNENNSKGRKVLITKEDYESIYGDMPEDL